MTSLRSYAADYLSRKPYPRDIEVRTILIRHFTDFMKTEQELNGLTPADGLRYHQHLYSLFESVQIAGRTANMRIAYAARMMSVAIRDGCFTGNNPFGHLPKFPERHREYFLERADDADFIGGCPPWLAVVVRVNLYLGLRAGEIRGLRRVDFRPNEGADGFISLDAAATKGERIKAARGGAGGARTVRIALTPSVSDAIRSRPLSMTHDRLFSDASGNPIGKSTMEKAVQAAWKRTAPRLSARRGVSVAEFSAEVKARGGFSFHTTRHTAATRDAEAGFTAQELIHKYRFGPRMVERYVHGNDDWAEMAARKRMEAEG